MKLADNIFWILPTLLVPVVVGAVFLLDRKYDAAAPELTTDPNAYEQGLTSTDRGDLRPETSPAGSETKAPAPAPAKPATSASTLAQNSSPKPAPTAPVSPAASAPEKPKASASSDSSAGSKPGASEVYQSPRPVSTPQKPESKPNPAQKVAAATPASPPKSPPSAPPAPSSGNTTPAVTSAAKTPKKETKPIPNAGSASPKVAATAPAPPQPSAPEKPKPVEPKPAPKETPKPKPQPEPAPKPAPTEYTIRSGDNPWTVANRYGVDMKDLLALNNIKDPKNLKIGQVLKLPPSKPGSSKPAASKPKSTPAPVKTVPAGSNYDLYTIKKGENPWSISKKLKVSHQSIIDLNKSLDFRDLKIGQQIKVPKK